MRGMCAWACACALAASFLACGSDGGGGDDDVSDVDASTSDVDAAPEVGECGPPDFEWRDAVLYFVMLDRFADGDPSNNGAAQGSQDPSGPGAGASARYVGGDIQGLRNKLDYIADLGATAIWLSPPYANRDAPGDGQDLKPADTHTYTGYHGYWPSPANIDYGSTPSDPVPDIEPTIDEHLGTNDDLKSLVSDAHGTAAASNDGILVLADYVMNHVDIDSGLYQAHPDWFATAGNADPTDPDRAVLCGDDPLCGGACWDHEIYGTQCSFTSYLPAFDFTNPEARAWSVADAVWWAREFGFDGFRLDAIKHVPDEWLTEMRTSIDAAVSAGGSSWPLAGEKFYLVGETFEYARPQYLSEFVDPATALDGQFDFPLRARLCQAIFHGRDETTDWLREFQGSIDVLAQWMEDGGVNEMFVGEPLPAGTGNDDVYGEGALMSTWIGNHDIPRAIHAASGQNQPAGNCFQGALLGWVDNAAGEAHPEVVRQFNPSQPTGAEAYERMALAFAVLLTNPGVPLIYYGDEIGMAGAGDPDNRRMMPFADGDAIPAGADMEDQLALSPSTEDLQLGLRRTVRRLAHIRAENRALTRGVRTTLSSTPDSWVYVMGRCEEYAPITVAINRADVELTVPIPAGEYDDLMTDAVVSGGDLVIPPRGFAILRPR